VTTRLVVGFTVPLDYVQRPLHEEV
jgi:hypothetical protein